MIIIESARRAICTTIFLIATLAAVAASYTVESVPNVQTANRDRFTSNPDGILSRETVNQLDRMIGVLRNSTSAEVAVVAIDDIDSDDVDLFATNLFEHWGLGKTDRDNGLLLLIVKDRRKMAIRVGQGLEGVLPDVACGRLIRNVMRPAFQQDDFDGGTLRAMDMITKIIADPANADEVMSSLPDKRSGTPTIDNDLTMSDALGFLGGLGLIAAIGLLIAFIVVRRNNRNHSVAEQWSSMMVLRTIALFACFCGLGIPLIAYIPIALTMKRMRSHHAPCPNCGGKMHKLDEETDNNYLTHAQDTEEKLNSIDYDVWLCDHCGTTDVIPYVNRASSYTQCPACGAKACTLTRDVIVRQPTTRQQGEGIKTYTCLACHNSTNHRYNIAKLASAAPIIIGGAGGFGRGGGSSFGGGFGGGSTMGGGASGGW